MTTTKSRRNSARRSGRREQNKAENRTALLKAARAVFAEMGYGAASVRDIVRRTDLASGTFYNYFKDKDEIFEAVVGELTGALLQRHGNGRGRAATAEESFASHYAVYFNFLVEDTKLLALARSTSPPSAPSSTARRPLARPGPERQHPPRHHRGRTAQCRHDLSHRLDRRVAFEISRSSSWRRDQYDRRRRRIRRMPDDRRPGPSTAALILQKLRRSTAKRRRSSTP